MALFGRVAKIIVGQPGGNGLQIEGLRIAFSISKTGARTPNNSNVRVWNLSRTSREIMEPPGTRLVLYAGYEQQDGAIKIFEGEVVFVWSSREGAEVITQFDLGEGSSAFRDTMISRSYQGASSSLNMIRDIAGDMGLGVDFADNLPSRSWQNGISFHGPARSALDRVTRPDGLSWSIQGGSIQVVRTGGPTRRRAILIAADSGMIGSPERKREGPREAARVRDQATGRQARVATTSQAYNGWEVDSLLMPAIVPNDTVMLQADTVNGAFVVRELRHIGDTHEGNDRWKTELKLVDSATAARLTTADSVRAERAARRRARAATP